MSARLTAASPQATASGNAIRVINERNQSALGSPCAAEIHESMVIGAESGADSEVDPISP